MLIFRYFVHIKTTWMVFRESSVDSSLKSGYKTKIMVQATPAGNGFSIKAME